jgi:hypothetical protein
MTHGEKVEIFERIGVLTNVGTLAPSSKRRAKKPCRTHVLED